MSTRTLLKDRRHFFKLALQKDPTNTVAKKVIDEITKSKGVRSLSENERKTPISE